METKLKYQIAMQSNLVPFVQGRPGEAKSSIAKKIAEDNKFQYIDLRLSTKDETDLGTYPILDKTNKTLEYAIPGWALRAKKYKENGYKGTLIHFEELNRCSQNIRNAALGILLERVVADEDSYLVDNNIWFMASGNMGVEDGCEVEEFDAALNGRLVHFQHELDVKEWVRDFAKENVDEYIINYLDHKSDYFWFRNADDNAYASARTWTMLSNIIKTLRKTHNDDMYAVVKDLTHFAPAAVGNTAGPAFVEWMFQKVQNEKIIDYRDVLNGSLNKHNSQKLNKTLQADTIAEILTTLKVQDINKFTKKEFTNVCNFISKITEEYATTFIFHIVETLDDTKEEEYFDILENKCKDLLEVVKEELQMSNGFDLEL